MYMGGVTRWYLDRWGHAVEMTALGYHIWELFIYYNGWILHERRGFDSPRFDNCSYFSGSSLICETNWCMWALSCGCLSCECRSNHWMMLQVGYSWMACDIIIIVSNNRLVDLSIYVLLSYIKYKDMYFILIKLRIHAPSLPQFPPLFCGTYSKMWR